MQPALYNYDVYPKVFPMNEPTEITVKPLGKHAEFSGIFPKGLTAVSYTHLNLPHVRDPIGVRENSQAAGLSDFLESPDTHRIGCLLYTSRCV